MTSDGRNYGIDCCDEYGRKHCDGDLLSGAGDFPGQVERAGERVDAQVGYVLFSMSGSED